MSFNPEQFMNSVLNDANSTSIPLCPPGEYVGNITDVNVESGTISKGDKAGQPWVKLNVQLETSDAAALAGTQMTKRKVRAGIMLDVNGEGNLEMGEGRNITLGRFGEAVALNHKAAPPALSMLPGRSTRFVVSHRVDRDDAAKFYEDVKAFRAL